MSNYNFPDPWSLDAFSTASLTAAVNEIDHVPDRAGQVVFAQPGVAQPINTTSVVIERVAESIKLIQTTARGAPAEKERADKRSMVGMTVPHIQIEDTILAESVQGVREFGTANQTVTVESAVLKQLQKMVHRIDFTLEHHRLGALEGLIVDADGSVLLDLYAVFGFQNSEGIVGPEEFDFDLDNVAADATDIRLKCQDVSRWMKRSAKMAIPTDAQVWAFAGDNFYDKLLGNKSVKATYNGIASAEAALGENYAQGVFEYGGIFFDNYQGSDDNSTIAIDPDECRFFLANVPGLYTESYAPADFIETVNTPGLPRYAKLAPDLKFQKSAELHIQTNPLPLCLRPSTLCKGVVSL